MYVICAFIFVTVFTLLNTTQSAYATVSCENFFSDTLVVNSEPLGQGTCSFGLQPPNFGQFLLLQRKTDALDDGINATATGITTQIRDRTGIDYIPTAASCISGPCDIRPTLSSRVALLCNSLLNATCRFNVTYTPIFGTGSNFTAELEVNYPSGTISAVVNGQEFSSPPAPPEIEVVSFPNGTSITPTFGFLEVGSSTPNPRPFDVSNSGNLALTFTGAPRIEITGEHAGDFLVLRDLPASLGGGQFDIPTTFTSFELGFLPTATGTRNATVTIRNNDADEGVYTFNITGEGLIAGAPIVPAQMKLTATPAVADAGVGRILRYTITMPDPAQNAIDLAFEHSISNDVDALNAGVTLDATSLPTNPCGAGSSIAILSTNFIALRGGNLTAGESCSFDIRINVPNSALTADHTQLTSDLRIFSAGQLLSSTAAEFTYTVNDAQGPLFANLPVEQVLTANTGDNSVNLDVTTLGITATDNTDGPVPPVFKIGSFELTGAYDFPIGSTTVSVDAEDVLGNAAAQETFIVTVKPPIELATLTLSVLPEVAAAGVPRTLRYTLTLPDIAEPVSAIGFEHDVAFVVGSVFIDTARLPANPCGIGSSATLASPSFLILRTAGLNAGESCTFDIGLTVPVTTAQGVFNNLTSPIRSTVDAVERSGPQVTAPFTIIADTDAPVINNVLTTQNLTTSGIATASLDVTTLGVTVTDNVDVGLTPLFRIGSTVLTGPFDFPLGNTEVTIDATDVAGNTATQVSFTVAVAFGADTTPPVITPPANITQVNDMGMGTANVSFSATVVDNLGEVIAPEFAIAGAPITSPHDFPLGVTTVDVSATDSAGNTGTAQFTVTVTDGEAPVISNLPTIATATVASGSATAIVTWVEPTASDNVGVVSFTSTANSGDAFPVGLNTVTYTARDAAGNETSESFDIVVNAANVLMVTGALVGGPIDVGGTGTYRITVTNPNNMDAIDASVAAVVGSVSAPLTIAGLGAGTPVVSGPCTGFMGTASPSFTAVAAQGGTVPANASCSVDIPITTTNATPAGEFPIFGVAVGEVNGVELTGAFSNLAKLVITAPDTTAPVITVPADISVSTDAGQPNAVVTFTVTAADDVDGDVSGAVVVSQASGSAFPVGVTTVTADVMDSSGNAATQASFTVTVTDDENPVIVGLPADIDVGSAAGTGLAVTWVEPTVTDNVGATLSATANSGDTFPIGVTTVTYTARDTAGNEVSDSFTVTVRDAAAPVITVPADIVVSNDAGQATAVVAFAVTAADSVDGDLSGSVVLSQASGSAFPVGVTTVTADVVDSDSNAALQESFTVTVNDTEAPDITVPADLSLVAAVGATTAIATFGVTAFDVVDGDISGSVVLSQASGTAFPIGTTVVTADVQDAAGNSAAQAQFNVVVRDGASLDTTAPVITVPADISVSTDAGQPNAVVNFTVTASDNVDGDISGSVVLSQASGTAFLIGATTVTADVIDSSGNAATQASFKVTVGDGELPVFVGIPTNITQSTDAGLSTAVVTFTAPTANDNVDGAITPVLVSSPTTGLSSGDTFPLGVTTLTYTATDAADNAQVASFTVTVGDDEAPVFTTFPSDIALSVDFPATTTVANWSVPTATDNVPGLVAVAQTAGPASGATFPVGTTTVTYTTTDIAGNIATQSFTVTVTTIPPGTVTFVVNSDVDGTYNIQSTEPVLNTAIVASSGLGRSSVISLRPGSFPVTFTVPDGIGVERAQCDVSNSTLNAATLSGTIVIASGVAVTCTIATRDSVRETVAQIGTFLETRSQLILQNQPNTGRRIDRLEGRATNNGGISGFGLALKNDRIPFAAQIGTNDISFSYSMREARAKGAAPTVTGDVTSVLGAFGITPSVSDEQTVPLFPKEEIETAETEANPADTVNLVSKSSLSPALDIKGLADADTQEPNISNDPEVFPFDIWAEGKISQFEAGSGKGSFGVIHIGADYLIKPRVLLGLSVQGDWTNLDGQNAGSRTEGFGFLITPYVTAKLSEGFYFDARAGWGKAYNDISPFGTYTDSFDTERWIASAALIGTWNLSNGLQITPEARLSYFKEVSESYTDSLNVLIPSVEVETGTFEFGPTFSKDFTTDKGSIYSPFLTVEGIWTFSQKNTTANFTNQANLSNEGVRVRLEAGVSIQSHNDSSLSLSANYDGIGDNNFSSWGASLRFDYQF